MILQQTIVRTFHRKNAGLYLLILLFGGGFLSGREHKELARIIMARPDFLLLVSTLWLIMVGQSVVFLRSFMQLPANEFLYAISLLKSSKKYSQLALMQIGLNAFPLSYSVLWLVIGVSEQRYLSVLTLFFIHLILIIVPIGLANKVFSQPNAIQSHRIPTFVSFDLLRFVKSHFIQYLLRYEFIYLLLQKLFALFILVGVAYLYPSDAYDIRLFRIGVLLVASGYFTLGQRFQIFYTNYYQFTRNLPISINTFFSTLLKQAILFVVFELIIVLFYFPLKASAFIWLDVSAFLISIAVFWQISFFRFPTIETQTQHVIFLAHALVLLLIMFKIPLFIIAFGLSIYSFRILRITYWRYEAERKD